jgi:hypothetical protein
MVMKQKHYLQGGGRRKFGRGSGPIGCERFTIKKGEYISEHIENFMKNIPAMGEAFQEMCRDKRIDSNDYCIEMYLNNNKDVLCMVKLDPAKR